MSRSEVAAEKVPPMSWPLPALASTEEPALGTTAVTVAALRSPTSEADPTWLAVRAEEVPKQRVAPRAMAATSYWPVPWIKGSTAVEV